MSNVISDDLSLILQKKYVFDPPWPVSEIYNLYLSFEKSEKCHISKKRKNKTSSLSLSFKVGENKVRSDSDSGVLAYFLRYSKFLI